MSNKQPKKQTAVEWLMNYLDQNRYWIGNDLLEAAEQAKQMEKEQSISILTKYHNSLFYLPFKDGEAEAIYNNINFTNDFIDPD